LPKEFSARTLTWVEKTKVFCKWRSHVKIEEERRIPSMLRRRERDHRKKGGEELWD